MDPLPEFQWEHTANVNGHRTWVFKFRVPQSSGYALIESKRTLIVPYEGRLYADPESGVVFRIEVSCDIPGKIPGDSEYKQLELFVDFKPVDVSGREFVLPSHFHLHVRKLVRHDIPVIGETVSDADYKQYRRFAADTSLRYEPESSPGR